MHYFSYGCVELPEKLGFSHFKRLSALADKAALTRNGVNITFGFKLTIGLLNRVRVNGKLSGKVTDRGDLFVGLYHACDNSTAQAVLDLLVYGTRVPVIYNKQTSTPN